MQKKCGLEVVPHPLDVAHHRRDELVDVVELAHGAQPRDELELHLLAVEVPFEVEQVRFAGRRRAVGERRGDADLYRAPPTSA